MKFTIDPDRAVELLGRLQLPDPRFYLLKLVQAGVASGAPLVEVEVGFFGVEVRFLTPSTLDTAHLFRHLVAPGERALRHLAIGVNSAPFAVTLEQGEVRQVFSAKGSWEEKCRFREGLAVRMRRTAFPSSEMMFLRERCRWSPVPVLINGLDPGLEPWGRHQAETYLFGSERLRAPGSSLAKAPPRLPAALLGSSVRCGGALALVPQGSRVDLVLDGVIVASRRGVPGMLAVLDAEGLKTDLSGLEIVEDEAYLALLEELPEQFRLLRER